MNPFSLWVYLSTAPLVWLTATLLAWLAADALAKASGRHPVVNPVLIAVLLVAATLPCGRKRASAVAPGPRALSASP